MAAASTRVAGDGAGVARAAIVLILAEPVRTWPTNYLPLKPRKPPPPGLRDSRSDPASRSDTGSPRSQITISHDENHLSLSILPDTSAILAPFHHSIQSVESEGTADLQRRCAGLEERLEELELDMHRLDQEATELRTVNKRLKGERMVAKRLASEQVADLRETVRAMHRTLVKGAQYEERTSSSVPTGKLGLLSVGTMRPSLETTPQLWHVVERQSSVATVVNERQVSTCIQSPRPECRVSVVHVERQIPNGMQSLRLVRHASAAAVDWHPLVALQSPRLETSSKCFQSPGPGGSPVAMFHPWDQQMPHSACQPLPPSHASSQGGGYQAPIVLALSGMPTGLPLPGTSSPAGLNRERPPVFSGRLEQGAPVLLRKSMPVLPRTAMQASATSLVSASLQMSHDSWLQVLGAPKYCPMQMNKSH